MLLFSIVFLLLIIIAESMDSARDAWTFDKIYGKGLHKRSFVKEKNWHTIKNISKYSYVLAGVALGYFSMPFLFSFGDVWVLLQENIWGDFKLILQGAIIAMFTFEAFYSWNRFGEWYTNPETFHLSFGLFEWRFTLRDYKLALFRVVLIAIFIWLF